MTQLSFHSISIAGCKLLSFLTLQYFTFGENKTKNAKQLSKTWTWFELKVIGSSRISMDSLIVGG